MPCGFARDGVRLIVRLRHYRACPSPACQERAAAATAMRKAIADDLRRQKREHEECAVAGAVGRNFR